MHIGKHDIEAGLHDAERAACEHHALVVEPGHQDARAAVDLPQNVLFGDFAILEHQFAGVGAAHPQLVEFLGGREAPEPLFDQEGRDAARASVRVGFGVNHERVRVGAVGDPHFAAVEDVTVAAPVGAGAHRDHVGPRARLTHGERADMLAGDELRQIFALLLLSAVAADLVDAQVRVRAVGEGHRRGRAGNLLHGHDVSEVAEPRAAIVLLDGDAEESHLAELAPEVGRKDVVPVDVRGARRDFFRREGASRVAQHVERLAEVEVQA